MLRASYSTIVLLAEGEGFEPPETLRPQRFSRPPQSSTLPSLLNHTLAAAWPRIGWRQGNTPLSIECNSSIADGVKIVNW
jgi:hypothetical protein